MRLPATFPSVQDSVSASAFAAQQWKLAQHLVLRPEAVPSLLVLAVGDSELAMLQLVAGNRQPPAAVHSVPSPAVVRSNRQEPVQHFQLHPDPALRPAAGQRLPHV